MTQLFVPVAADKNNNTPINRDHPQHHDALATAVNLLQDELLNGLIKRVPAPTGNAALDTVALTTVSPGITYQLDEGTYIVNPITFSSLPGTRLIGASGRSTIIKSSAANATAMITVPVTSPRFRMTEIIFDGNSTTPYTGATVWEGLVEVQADDCQIRDCGFQNFYKYAIHGKGSLNASLKINDPVIERCDFDNGLGGAFLEDGINCGRYAYNRHTRLTSNALKSFGSSTYSCPNWMVLFNEVDYSLVTAGHSTVGALGLELTSGGTVGCPYALVVGNKGIGPANGATGNFWFISLGYSPYSQVFGNEVKRFGTRYWDFGIEAAEAAYCVIGPNVVGGCVTGTNLTNNSPVPSHYTQVRGLYYDCSSHGIVIDSNPSGVDIQVNMVDAGGRFIFATQSGTPVSGLRIHDSSFYVDSWTQGDLPSSPENLSPVAIYLVGNAANEIYTTISNCHFGPRSGGVGTVGLIPLEMNNVSGVRFIGNTCDGRRPDTLANTANYCILGYNGKLYSAMNRAFGFTSAYSLTPNNTNCQFWADDIGALTNNYGSVTGSANASNVYLSNSDGRVHFRNAAGTDAVVGP